MAVNTLLILRTLVVKFLIDEIISICVCSTASVRTRLLATLVLRLEFGALEWSALMGCVSVEKLRLVRLEQRNLVIEAAGAMEVAAYRSPACDTLSQQFIHVFFTNSYHKYTYID